MKIVENKPRMNDPRPIEDVVKERGLYRILYLESDPYVKGYIEDFIAMRQKLQSAADEINAKLDIVPYDKWESVAGCYPPETRLRRVLGEEEYSFVVVSQTLLNNNSRPAPYQLASVLIGLFNLVGDKVYFMVSSSQNEQKLGYIKEKILDGFKEQKAIDKYDLTDLLVK